MTSLRLKRGTTQINSYTEPHGELTVDTIFTSTKLYSLRHSGSLTKFKKGTQGVTSHINVTAYSNINFLMEEY